VVVDLVRWSPDRVLRERHWVLGRKERDEEEAFEKEKEVELSGSRAAGLREKRVRKRWDDTKMSALTTVNVDSKNNVPSPEHDG
jgi:hypothetical protein